MVAVLPTKPLKIPTIDEKIIKTVNLKTPDGNYKGRDVLNFYSYQETQQ